MKNSKNRTRVNLLKLCFREQRRASGIYSTKQLAVEYRPNALALI